MKSLARVLLYLAVILVLAALVVAAASGAASATAAGVWAEVGPGSATGGGISQTPGESGWPAVAAAPDGTVYVAWYDSSGGDTEIYVKKWDGSAWSEVGANSASGGGISNNSGESKAVALAVGPDGRPCAAWRDWSSGKPEVYVRCWNGNDWAEVGAGSASAGGVSKQGGNSRFWPSIAISPNGSINVAWDNSDGKDQEIWAARWDGSTWQRLGAESGNVSGNSGNSWIPVLALDPAGNPYISWQDESSGTSQIYVRKWDGTAWVNVGGTSAAAGGISGTSGRSARSSIAFARDGLPYVSWLDETPGNAEVYIRKWNGSSWVEVGEHSASENGISRNPGDSLHPQMATDGRGMPCLAWYDRTPGITEIYSRCYNGERWVELAANSASGGGISRNAGFSSLPAITSDGNRLYAAWGDNSTGNYEIYVRSIVTFEIETPTATATATATNTPVSWAFLPAMRGERSGPTITPSPVPPTATEFPTPTSLPTLTPGPTDTPVPGRLAAPVLFDIQNQDKNGSFEVSWSQVPQAGYYQLQEQGRGAWGQIYEGSARNYARSGLRDGQYCYRARALNSSTLGDWSAIKCTTVDTAPTATPTNTPRPTITPMPSATFPVYPTATSTPSPAREYSCRVDPGMYSSDVKPNPVGYPELIQLVRIGTSNPAVLLIIHAYNGDGSSAYSQEYGLQTERINEAYYELKAPRLLSSAIQLSDGRVLISGGIKDESGDSIPTDSAELVTLGNTTTESVGSLNIRRSGHQSLLLSNGEVFIMGGFTEKEPVAVAEIFNLGTKKFRQTAVHPTLQGELGLLELENGKVLVAGRRFSSYEQLYLALYDPTRGFFSEITGYPEELAQMSLHPILLPNGKVYFFGVIQENGYEADQTRDIIYDPEQNTFVSVSRTIEITPEKDRDYHSFSPMAQMGSRNVILPREYEYLCPYEEEEWCLFYDYYASFDTLNYFDAMTTTYGLGRFDPGLGFTYEYVLQWIAAGSYRGRDFGFVVEPYVGHRYMNGANMSFFSCGFE